NYGGAGADSIAGASATNSSGVANGAFDTFIRFNTFSMITNLNALYGSNNWVITSAMLQVTEQAAPNNGLFNRGQGAFEIRWIANDSWIEGTGTPVSPNTSGIVYTNEPALLNAGTDVSLGIYTNAAVDGAETFALPLASAFVNDIQAGGDAGFFMTAVNSTIGFTFSSRTFTPINGRPFLIVSAVPKPGIALATLIGADLKLSCTNGAVGANYRVLSSPDATVPFSQWTPVATNTLAADGPFTVTISNVSSSGLDQQFFTVQAQ
ncbi:MAG: hypothetical protein ACXWC8_21195, partial [Limisphaerales bacterium]